MEHLIKGSRKMLPGHLSIGGDPPPQDTGHQPGPATHPLHEAPTALRSRAPQASVTIGCSNPGELQLVNVLFTLLPYCGSWCLLFATLYNGLLMHTRLNNVMIFCHHLSGSQFLHPTKYTNGLSPGPMSSFSVEQRGEWVSLSAGWGEQGLQDLKHGGVTPSLHLEGREHVGRG